MARIFVVSLLAGFLLGYTVRAAHASTGRSTGTTTSAHSADLGRYSITAVAEIGPASVSDHTAPDLQTSGTFREILAMVNRSTAEWNLGAGIGFFSADVTGNSSVDTNPGVSLSSYSQSTTGEVARLSASYRVTDQFEIGLTGDVLFGTNVNFSSDLFAPTMGAAFLGGAEALYGFNLAGLRCKAGARYFASLNMPDRKLDAVQGVFQASFPLN